MSTDNLNKFLSYVKVILNISWSDEDAEIKSYIKTCYAYIAKHTGIYFLKGTPAEIEDVFDWAWNRTVWLAKAPITARSKLEYNGGTQNTPDRQTIDADDYTKQNKNGKLVYLPWFPRGFQNIKATYTYWYDFDSLPFDYEDLKFAVAKMVWVARDLVAIGAVNQETVSGTTIQYSKEFQDSGVSQIISLYSNMWM